MSEQVQSLPRPEGFDQLVHQMDRRRSSMRAKAIPRTPEFDAMVNQSVATGPLGYEQRSWNARTTSGIMTATDPHPFREAISWGLAKTLSPFIANERGRITDEVLGFAFNIPNGITVGEQFGNLKNSTLNAITSTVASLPKGLGIMHSMGARKLQGNQLLKAEDMLLYRLGEGMEQIAREKFPTDPRLQDDWLTSIGPQAVGSAATFFAAAWATRGLGLGAKGQFAAIFALGGTANAVPEWERSMSEFKITNDADRQFLWNVAVGGVLEATQMDSAMSAIIRGDNWGKMIVRQMIEEGFQGGAVQYSQNIVAGRPGPEGVDAAAFAEMMGGGPSIAITSAVGGRHIRKLAKVKKEARTVLSDAGLSDDQIDDLVGTAQAIENDDETPQVEKLLELQEQVNEALPPQEAEEFGDVTEADIQEEVENLEPEERELFQEAVEDLIKDEEAPEELRDRAEVVQAIIKDAAEEDDSRFRPPQESEEGAAPATEQEAGTPETGPDTVDPPLPPQLLQDTEDTPENGERARTEYVKWLESLGFTVNSSSVQSGLGYKNKVEIVLGLPGQGENILITFGPDGKQYNALGGSDGTSGGFAGLAQTAEQFHDDIVKVAEGLGLSRTAEQSGDVEQSETVLDKGTRRRLRKAGMSEAEIALIEESGADVEQALRDHVRRETPDAAELREARQAKQSQKTVHDALERIGLIKTAEQKISRLAALKQIIKERLRADKREQKARKDGRRTGKAEATAKATEEINRLKDMLRTQVAQLKATNKDAAKAAKDKLSQTIADNREEIAALKEEAKSRNNRIRQQAEQRIRRLKERNKELKFQLQFERLLHAEQVKKLRDDAQLGTELEREKARAALKKLREKKDRERKAAVELAKERARAKAHNIKLIKQVATEIIRQELSGKDANLRGVFLTDLRDVSTLPGLARIADKIEKVLERKAEKAAQSHLKETIAKVQAAMAGEQVKGKKRPGMKPAFADAAQSILDMLDPKKMSAKKRHQLTETAFVFMLNEDLELPLGVIDSLTRLDRVPVADMDVETAQTFDAILSSILQQSRLLNILKIKGRNRDRARVALQVLSELEDETTPAQMIERPVDPETGRRKRESKGGLGRLAFGGIENMTLKSLTMLFAEGKNTEAGKSMTAQVLYRNIVDARANGLAHYRDSVRFMDLVLEAVGYEPGSEELAAKGDAFAQPTNRVKAALDIATSSVEVVNDGKGITLTPGLVSRNTGRVLENGKPERVSKHENRVLKITGLERVHILMSLMDPKTRDLILHKGVPIQIQSHDDIGEVFSLSRDDLELIEESAMAEDPREMELARNLVSYINGPLKGIARAYSIYTWGYDFTEKGTYVPRHRTGIEGQEVSLSDSASTLRPKVLRSSGVFSERVNSKDQLKPIQIRDAVTEFNSHAWAVSMVSHLDPAVRDAQKVLKTPAVRSAILKTKHGRKFLARFEDTYKELAASVVGRPESGGVFDKAFGLVTRNLTKALLGYNPMVATYQPWSLIAAATVIEEHYLFEGMGAAFDMSVNERMNQHPEIWFRNEASSQGLISSGQEEHSGSTGVGGFTPTDDRAFFMIRAMDQAAIRVIFRASELKAEAQLREQGVEPNPGRIQELAGEIAIEVIRESQPTPGDPMHESAAGIDARKNKTGKIFTMFRAQRLKNVDIIYRNALLMMKDPDNIAKHSKNVFYAMMVQSVGIAATKQFWFYVLAAPALLAGRGGRKKKEEEDKMKAWGKATIEAASGNFIFGQFLALMINRVVIGGRIFTPDITPISSLGEDLFYGTAQFAGGAWEWDYKTMTKAMTRVAAAGMAFRGKPVVAPLRLFDRVVENFETSGGGGSARPRR